MPTLAKFAAVLLCLNGMTACQGGQQASAASTGWSLGHAFTVDTLYTQIQLAEGRLGAAAASFGQSSTSSLFESLVAGASNDTWSLAGTKLSGMKDILSAERDNCAEALAAYPTWSDLSRATGSSLTQAPSRASLELQVSSMLETVQSYATPVSHGLSVATDAAALDNLTALAMLSAIKGLQSLALGLVDTPTKFGSLKEIYQRVDAATTLVEMSNNFTRDAKGNVWPVGRNPYNPADVRAGRVEPPLAPEETAGARRTGGGAAGEGEGHPAGGGGGGR